MRMDIEIAQAAQLRPIQAIAAQLGISEQELFLYGRDKAKIDLQALETRADAQRGKLILVTAINPTPAGEGKTTVSVGLTDALSRLGKKVAVTLREPSMGPVFGIKGGAAGGGYSQVVPMEDINLHFTGDIHAISAANNLLAAMVDNHIFQGNALKIHRVVWRRCLDMNDRQLRQVTTGLGLGCVGGVLESGFDITAASEVMAILCLSSSFADLKLRLSRIVVGYTKAGDPITAGDLQVQGAMAALLKSALCPNLVQTLEGTPALIHGGPFANIAHGCASILSTQLALKTAEYVVSEAGFGGDLGAEKFIDIKCRTAGLFPDVAVLVCTARALKMHGGVRKEDLDIESTAAVRSGMDNLLKHVENLRGKFGLPVVVAINRFPGDTVDELGGILSACQQHGIQAVLTEVWEKGGAGGEALAQAVLDAIERTQVTPAFAYELNMPLDKKVQRIARDIYGAADVEFSAPAMRELEHLEALGYGHLPVCMAKTQYSLSDDARKLGRPEGFTLSVRSIRLSAGAGFVVALTGDIMTMPGLPKNPSACNIDVCEDGCICGLF